MARCALVEANAYSVKYAATRPWLEVVAQQIQSFIKLSSKFNPLHCSGFDVLRIQSPHGPPISTHLGSQLKNDVCADDSA